MKRLLFEQRDRIMKMIIEGKSLNEISKITNLSKTTIYYYMRKKLGRKYPLMDLNNNDLELVGEAIGFFAGDGSLFHDLKKGQWHVRFIFNKNEIKVINYYIESLKRLTGKIPFRHYGKSVTILYYNSKVLGNFCSDYLKWEDKKGVNGETAR